MTLHLRKCRGVAMACCALAALSLVGCNTTGMSRYANNRVNDLADIVEVGVGATWENANSFMPSVPPALGVYAQATDYANVGVIHFSGYAAELDGRGAFAGRESRTQVGLLATQWAKVYQDYEAGKENYFKKWDSPWAERMEGEEMSWRETPAKRLHYESDFLEEGIPLHNRGWQYWGKVGGAVAVCEPFLLHAGVTARLSLDPSELMDFVLGLFTVDFKYDDLLEEELLEPEPPEEDEAVEEDDGSGAPAETAPAEAASAAEPASE